MAGGNKSNSAKAKKRKLQMQVKAKAEDAAKRNRRGAQGFQRSEPRG